MNLAELSWSAVDRVSKDIPIVIPIAALEQHGLHLPVFTDSFLLAEVIRRAALQFESRALFAPLLWLGNSHHHLDFAGTLSAKPRVYLDLLSGVAENFLQHGFRRLVFVNGHGGNDVPGQQTIFELRQRHRQRDDVLFLFATYWRLAAAGRAEIGTSLAQKSMGHACEWETSMMLRLAPHLVGDYQNVPPVEFGTSFEPATRAWITRDRSVPGHIGFPHLASAEKGEMLFQVFSDDLVAFLDRVICWDGKSWNG